MSRTLMTAIAAALPLAIGSLSLGQCCLGDVNGDGQVDGADLGSLLGSWGPGGGAADFNGDGFVNGADLGSLLGAWGPCPPCVSIDSVFPLSASVGDVLVLSGSGFGEDPSDYCVAALSMDGEEPRMVSLRAIAATGSELMVEVRAIPEGVSTGQVMLELGDGSIPVPPSPAAPFGVMPPGVWVWLSNGGPSASSSQTVQFSQPSTFNCDAYYGVITGGEIVWTIPFTGGTCPLNSTFYIQLDAPLVGGGVTQVDAGGDFTSNVPFTLVQCATQLCNKLQTALFLATGDFFGCSTTVVGGVIYLTLSAPAGASWDVSPWDQYLEICTP